MFGALHRWYSNLVTRDERAVDRIFEGRAALSDEAFFNRYFTHTDIPKEVAIGVRRTLIEKAPIDMHRLVPEDRFGGTLSAMWGGDSLADVETICELEKRFGISIAESDGPVASMGDLIALVDRKTKEKKKG